MSENEQLTDEQKAALQEQERVARMWSKSQAEETAKRDTSKKWGELGWMNSEQGRDFIRRTCGFDPGW